MKPKKLRREQKEFLAKEGIDHHQFLLIEKLAECYKFYHKKTCKVVSIRR